MLKIYNQHPFLHIFLRLVDDQQWQCYANSQELPRGAPLKTPFDAKKGVPEDTTALDNVMIVEVMEGKREPAKQIRAPTPKEAKFRRRLPLAVGLGEPAKKGTNS
jgi:hypothetical protein